jgi:soluble lytic murein transglycosylase-like protein
MSTDRGLFQINDKAHPYAPAWDIKGATFYAARYLRWLKSVTGTWRDALIAYNVGIGKWMRGIRPARYARLVLAMDEVYK